MRYYVSYKWIDREGNIHQERIWSRRPSEAYALQAKLLKNDLCLDVEVKEEK